MGPGEPTAIFGITLPLLIALIVALIRAWCWRRCTPTYRSVLRTDQIISGVIINIAAVGLTGYLNTIIATSSPRGAGSFDALEVPPDIANIPVIGWLINAIFDQGPIGIATIFIVIILNVLLFRTRWGLRTRAVGEHPRAAETVGINVIRLRYRNVIGSGALAALAGAYLTIELTTSFQANMTNGRGFIGLAAMIVGRWTPIGAFGAALLFFSADALNRAVKFAAPDNDMGRFLESIPPQFYDALPYLITIIVLAGVVGSQRAACGRWAAVRARGRSLIDGR